MIESLHQDIANRQITKHETRKRMSKTEAVYLSQLEEVQILWPGDVRALAEFVLRCRDATDSKVNASSNGTQKSRPTLHGLALYLARIMEIPEESIEQLFKTYGFNLAATVEFDLAPNAPAGP